MRPRTDHGGDRPRATFIAFPPDAMFVFILRRLMRAVFVMLAVTCIAGVLFQFGGHPVVYMPGPDATSDQNNREHG